MFPGIDYIKTIVNGIKLRIEIVEKSFNQALSQIKTQVFDVIQDIKNIRVENTETIKSSTADWSQNDPNALDYVKNRTHYMLPATPIGSLVFTATTSNTIEYTLTSDEEEFAILSYFQSLSYKGEVLKVTIGDKTGLLSVTFDRGYFGFSGVFSGGVKWVTGNVLSLVAQNDFITFNQGDVVVSFEDTTTPYYNKLDFNYLPDNVYHSENAPVKFGSGELSAVQGYNTEASGNYSHAEGYGTEASGFYSHAEGYGTEASGFYSHAEGSDTVASEYGSHAEGYGTEASGERSHAEGGYTVANRKYMHVEGVANKFDESKFINSVRSGNENSTNLKTHYAAQEYAFDSDTGYYTLIDAEIKNEVVVGLYYANKNQYDNGKITSLRKPLSIGEDGWCVCEILSSVVSYYQKDKYIHVAGNGDINDFGTVTSRSNAYTLDWHGVPWFQGRPQFGGAEQDDGSQTVMANGDSEIILSSPGGKKFSVKVDDSGTLSATEVV